MYALLLLLSYCCAGHKQLKKNTCKRTYHIFINGSCDSVYTLYGHSVVHSTTVMHTAALLTSLLECMTVTRAVPPACRAFSTELASTTPSDVTSTSATSACPSVCSCFAHSDTAGCSIELQMIRGDAPIGSPKELLFLLLLYSCTAPVRAQLLLSVPQDVNTICLHIVIHIVVHMHKHSSA
jgi:hypothetical protein